MSCSGFRNIDLTRIQLDLQLHFIFGMELGHRIEVRFKKLSIKTATRTLNRIEVLQLPMKVVFANIIVVIVFIQCLNETSVANLLSTTTLQLTRIVAITLFRF